MLASAVSTLLKRSLSRFSKPAPAPLVVRRTAAEPPVEAAVQGALPHTAWPAGRLALAHDLWGAGFIFPGGDIETLRLARPLGMSNAASLLLIGVGSGGPALTVTRNFGAWVTGMDTDPSLLAAATALVKRAQLTKKVTIKRWDPANPEIAARSHHHCLALEPLHGSRPEPILNTLAKAMRPGGQMVITELTAAEPLKLTDPTVRRWGELEQRDPANVMASTAVTRILGRVGLDVRIAEDLSERHLDHAIMGWKMMLRDLGRKPSRQEAVPMVAEAELWLLRRRLIRDGKLQMMRWHAISRSTIT